MKTTLPNYKLFILTVCFGFGLSLNAQTTYTVQNTNDSGSGSLRDAINGASDGDIIRFDASLIAGGSATITLASALDVSTSLTFKGLYNSSDSLFISGDNNDAIFKFDNVGKTVLDSMLLINGYNQYGGAISFMNSDDTLWVNNSEILNSYAEYGGGIYAESDAAIVVLNNCKLVNNNVDEGGGAVYAYSNGTSASITLNNTFVKDNEAGYGGGACSETDNSANAYVFVDGSTIENNEAFNDEAGGIESWCYGDGIATVEVLNSLVKNNYAANYGGGVFAYSSDNNTSIIIDNCTIEGNFASSNGGGVYAEGINSEVTLTNGSINSNECGSYGGGVYIYGDDEGPTTITANNMSFGNNYSDDYGGSIYAEGQYLTVQLNNSEVNNNSAYYYGGAIYIYGDTSLVTIESSELNGNQTFSDNGGAIACYADNHIEMNVNESELSNNLSEYKGGAILVDSYDAELVKLNITNSTLNDNFAGESGGAISSYCYYGKSIVTVTNSTMSGNTANNEEGGAISSKTSQDTSKVVIVNSTLSNNLSVGTGGAIYSSSGDSKTIVEIKGSTLVENHASSGGAILAEAFNESSIIDILNSTIANNTADNQAGGILSYGDTETIFTVASSIISNDDNMYLINSSGIVSGGYNIFSDEPAGAISSGGNQDLVNVSATDLDLQPLANNGGTTLTAIPGNGSVAIDAGEPTDMTDAQNRSVINGRRDIGAAEYNCTALKTSLNETCDPLFVWMDGMTYTSNNNSAQYKFINSTGGCDTLFTLDLTLKTVNAGITQTSGTDLVAVAYQAGYQWINCFDNMPVNGETDQTFVPGANGDYAVIVTENGCTDTSVCIMVSTVGLDEISNDFGINIYPNPANDKVTITLNDFPSNDYSLVIYDAVGNAVINRNIVSQTTTIETSQLISGMYFVKVSDDKNTTVNRLVIE